MLPKRLNILFVFMFFVSINGIGQNEIITIEQTIEAAINKHPLNNKKTIIQNKYKLNIQSLKKKNLPDINLGAQASLQSENINLDFPLPNFESIELPLYKAQTNLESNYLLYDGGIVNKLIENEKLKENIEQQNVKVQLYNIKSRVVDVYFSLILLEEQKEILDSSLAVLKVQEKIIRSAIDNGVALKSDLDKLSIEKVKLNRNISTISNNIITLELLLSDLTGLDLKNKELKRGEQDFPKKVNWTNRPELELLMNQRNLLMQGEEIISAKNKPKVVLFAKAGVGYPNPFNFFDDNVSPFAIGGVQFSWKIWDWKKSSIEKQKLEIEKLNVDNQEEIFNENMLIETDKLVSEIKGLESNLHYDTEIIEKQNIIVKTLENQYLNGVITITDFITEQNNKRIAEIKASINKLNIEKLKYKLKVMMND